MTHRRKEGNQPSLVAPDVRRFLVKLGHSDSITPWIKIIQHCGVVIQLIAEHENEIFRSGAIAAVFRSEERIELSWDKVPFH